MRRRVADCELQAIHTRAPAPELYWAVIASMVDNGTANANVMRRDAPDQRTLDLVEQGKQSVCDPFWLAKLRAGPLWVHCESAPTANSKPLAPSQVSVSEAAPAGGSSGRSVDVSASILSVEPDDGVVPEGVTSKDKSSDTTALGEPLSSRTVDVHTGLPMTETLDILRHLWFHGPDCVASAHFAVWRHPEAIAATVKHLQKHVKTSLIKITIYSAIASGRVRTSRDAVPNDKELLKLCHGNTGSTSIGGLSRAQFDVLRAYRDGWEWSPFMPRLEGTATCSGRASLC